MFGWSSQRNVAASTASVYRDLVICYGRYKVKGPFLRCESAFIVTEIDGHQRLLDEWSGEKRRPCMADRRLGEQTPAPPGDFCRDSGCRFCRRGLVICGLSRGGLPRPRGSDTDCPCVCPEIQKSFLYLPLRLTISVYRSLYLSLTLSLASSTERLRPELLPTQ